MGEVGRGLYRIGSIVLVLGAGLLTGSSSEAAPPPPPSFWNFTITNNTGMDVMDVQVLMYAHVDGHYDQINQTSPIRLLASKVAPGSTITLGVPMVHGIVRIEATGKCPAPQSASVSITAQQSDFIPVGPQEYAGFCPESPTTPNGDFSPKLEFFMQGPQAMARLQGKSRWEAYYDPQPKSDEKAFE